MGLLYKELFKFTFVTYFVCNQTKTAYLLLTCCSLAANQKQQFSSTINVCARMSLILCVRMCVRVHMINFICINVWLHVTVSVRAHVVGKGVLKRHIIS